MKWANRIGSRLALTAILSLAPLVSLQGRSLTFELQTRDPKTGEIIRHQEAVDSRKLAVVIIDPWNYHWCMTACERVSAMVPRWNRALECARKLGLPILWGPSDVVGSYSGWPQRERALALAPLEVPKKGTLTCNFSAPVGRCMCGPGLHCIVNYGHDGIHPDLEIAETDYIVSSTQEVYTILQHHGITHVLYLGLHTNMCLFGKPGALRYMADAGLVCWLARDINDAFTHYDPATGYTPDRGTQQTDEDLERAGIPTINLVEEWRKAGFWNDDWIVETVRITPWGKPGRPFLFERSVTVTLTAPWLEHVDIRFTLNGKQPTTESPRYEKPLHLTETATLLTVACRNGRPVSLPTTACFVRLPRAVPKPDIFLDDRTPILDPYAGGGGRAFFWIPKVGQSFEGKELRVRGKKYAKGLGCRAPSSVRYAVEPEYERFVARAGVADDLLDENHGSNLASHGSVIFRVFVDGRLAAESPVMRVSQEPWRFDVALPAGSRQVTLACLDAGSRNVLDLANWVEAGFVLQEGSPGKAAAARSQVAWDPIPVPGAWESAPGGKWAGYDGVAWYRCFVRVPASWAGKNVSLHVERVDNYYVACVNGAEVGEGDFEQDPFGRHPVPGQDLRPGSWSLIALRVEDWGGAGGFRGESPVLYADDEAIELKGEWEFRAEDDAPPSPKWTGLEPPSTIGRFEKIVPASSVPRNAARGKN